MSATLVEATGPKSHVTGASTTPTSVPEVLDSRLAPSGTLTAPEKNRLCRCAMAQAGQAVNQTCCAGSPQPHVSVDDGCPDQTCHHSTTAGTAKQTMATTWKPTARTARRARLAGTGGVGLGCSSGAGASAAATSAATSVVTSKRSGPTGVPGVSYLGCVDTAFPTRHCRRAYSEAPRVQGPDAVGPVPMIVTVPDDRRCIVVGAGLLGLSAAWALSRRRWRVTRAGGGRRGRSRPIRLQG